MKYKGKELDVFKSDENIAFNPPRQMLVWNDVMDNPLVGYVGAFCPSRENAVIINDGGVYQHCAEIPKAKTNWEAYAERNGITISLRSALDVFHQRGPECIFCPAINFCRHSDFCRHSEGSCPLNFEEWAKSEYVPNVRAETLTNG